MEKLKEEEMRTCMCHLITSTGDGSLIAIASGKHLKIYDSTESSSSRIVDLGEIHSDYIRSLVFSPSGELVTAADDKSLIVWRKSNAQWKAISKRQTRKRITKMVFSASGVLIYGDKFGDVFYCSNVEQDENPFIHVMGHFSMITALTITGDGKHLISGDRDERIRVSHFPHTFNVEMFCMGHTALITALSIHPSHPDLLISGSLDGTVRLWKFQVGSLIHTLSLAQYLPQDLHNTDIIVRSIEISSKNELCAIACEGIPKIFMLRLDESKEQLFLCCIIDLLSFPFDITFDSIGNVVVAESRGMVTCYKIEENSGKFDGTPPKKRLRVEDHTHANSDVNITSVDEGASHAPLSQEICFTLSDAMLEVNSTPIVISETEYNQIEQGILMKTLKKEPKSLESSYY